MIRILFFNRFEPFWDLVYQIILVVKIAMRLRAVFGHYVPSSNKCVWCLFVFVSPSLCYANIGTRIEVPLFEGGAGLNFYERAATAYESLNTDLTVDLYELLNFACYFFQFLYCILKCIVW